MAWLPNTLSLDLDAADMTSKIRLSSKEQLMVITILVSTNCDSFQPVKIELALERSKLRLTEESVLKRQA
jgi:DNA repair photolyase